MMKNILRLVIIALCLVSTQDLSAQFSFKGKVMDENGNPLSGAHIIALTTYQFAISDKNGDFKLDHLKENQIRLQISYLGYQRQRKNFSLPIQGKQEIKMKPEYILTEEVVVSSTRAQAKTPVSQTNIYKSQIEEVNQGKDIPFILQSTPSVVATSDAGHGVGYTGLRIRGTDMSRINITVNGIPLNDSESHGVWWVNMPDFAGSLDNIQLQRGVGTSTNGAAAFGASINLQTEKLNPKAYASILTDAGSFNTLKNSVSVGTGLINKRFAFDARLSRISSDGFIDRASALLKSYYLSGTYYGKNSLLKFNTFSGSEKTYQAWNGVPKVRLMNDEMGMQRYADHWLYSQEEVDEMMDSDPRTYNLYTYENETDNYRQDHYQLFYTQKLNKYIHLNTALHYTRGKGYYEQYKPGEDLADYEIPSVIINETEITESDIVRQKWLDNHFIGGVFSVNKQKDNYRLTLGGGWNRYIGDHYGKVIWGQFIPQDYKDHQWYFNQGDKSDGNIYLKAEVDLTQKLFVYGDLQLRHINYIIDGIHDDLRDLSQDHQYLFFNPKAGISYALKDNQQLFISYAVAQREPARSGFRDADPGKTPQSEILYDLESGYSLRFDKMALQANAYYMNYKNQLVLNGEINNVGDPIYTNVDKSYRLGAELQFNSHFAKKLYWDWNLNFSRNKIQEFNSFVDDWDNGGQIEETINNTDISFSPSLVAGSSIRYIIINNLDIKLDTRYVGKQFVDNTMSEDRILNPYLINDISLTYRIYPHALKQPKAFKMIDIKLSVVNVLNTEYETNAWVYRYFYDGAFWEMDGYFPQAGRHFLAGLHIRI